MQTLRPFIDRLRQYPRVVIQAHDFPDHDAVSSAYAFSHLLSKYDIASLLVYNGVIDRISLQNMIDSLNIPIYHWQQTDLCDDDIIVTVDGCIGEKNVTDLPGAEIAVIDHHQVQSPGELWFSDIRPEYGATATIIREYYAHLNIDMPKAQATALQIGLAIDTANLTRGFVEADVQAFSYFHQHADQELVGRITRNTLQQQELGYYQTLIRALNVSNHVGFAMMEDGCPKNMLGILGDFLLSLDEIDVAIIAANAQDHIQLSLRSECEQVNVASLVNTVVRKQAIGFGGGHAHMAGGIIQKQPFQERFKQEDIYPLFMSAIGEIKQVSLSPAW